MAWGEAIHESVNGARAQKQDTVSSGYRVTPPRRLGYNIPLSAIQKPEGLFSAGHTQKCAAYLG